MRKIVLKQRIMSKQDFVLVNQWCVEEGWNLGMYDSGIYHQVDPSGHFLFLKTDEPVGAISLVKHKNDFYTVGPFIVNKKWRDLGMGKIIWQETVERLDGEVSVLLYAVPEQTRRYQKAGFNFYFENHRWCLANKEKCLLKTSADIKEIKLDNLQSISLYDEEIFQASRQRAFESLLNTPNSSGCFIGDKNDIQGFGFIRPCINGYRVGPLMAENLDIARQLVLALVKPINNGSIFIDSPSTNLPFHKLMQNLGFLKNSKYNTCAMIKGIVYKKIIENLERHLGIFSLEIG